ncbi:diaminopimelate decarboxylase [Chromatiales bacterium (ex Bugula neritina AB1)]|nr:diaminopimelate decarboxylase [Chromatiales bacterium (ex Bugula neritina AB1)]
MSTVQRQQRDLYIEGVPLAEVADRFGTPLFVYSRASIETAWRAFDSALAGRPHLVCYAMKANSNIAVLNLLAKLGSGFDIVSAGELVRVQKAGGDMNKVVFSGVGKKPAEMAQALEAKIRCFNVESLEEIEVLAGIAAAHGVNAPVSVRVNPDVDAMTHPYISTGLRDNKFGITMEQAELAYQRIAELDSLTVVGMDCHIGSQLTEISPYKDALKRLLSLCDRLEQQGIRIQHLDLGGGQGIRYQDEVPIDLVDWASAMYEEIGERNYEIIVEPGRCIVGNSGVLLTRVEYLKHTEEKNFAIVDAAMNDLIRPSLYRAWQDIVPVSERSEDSRIYDVVGPVCESGDYLGKNRELCLQSKDLLAVLSTGAYGFCMSSNYNTRARAAEVIVDGEQCHLVRERESIESLLAGESLLPG